MNSTARQPTARQHGWRSTARQRGWRSTARQRTRTETTRFAGRTLLFDHGQKSHARRDLSDDSLYLLVDVGLGFVGGSGSQQSSARCEYRSLNYHASCKILVTPPAPPPIHTVTTLNNSARCTHVSAVADLSHSMSNCHRSTVEPSFALLRTTMTFCTVFSTSHSVGHPAGDKAKETSQWPPAKEHQELFRFVSRMAPMSASQLWQFSAQEAHLAAGTTR